MARLILTLAALALPVAALGQVRQDEQFQQAGVCGRCHVISVVEWGMSRHRAAGTGCTSCHGASQGHVADERNNVKPDRLPHRDAIFALCVECHKDKSQRTGDDRVCQTCHHVHALVDPRQPAALKDDDLEKMAARQREFDASMEEGERLVESADWPKARTAYQKALQARPGDPRAAARLKLCERRIAPSFPGFEAASEEWDPGSGLPLRVRVASLGIRMALVPGGKVELGSDRFPNAQPAHTVHVQPFYLGQYEITQAEWMAVMGSNPSAHQGQAYPDAARMPVEQVSWDDAQAFVRKLNASVPGGGFRLPTEAEWEFAARAGEAAPRPSGRDVQAPSIAGSGFQDKLGLAEMLGNVWEWCSSLAMPYPYAAGDGRENPDATGLRVLRGGGFADPQDLLDPAFRHAERPNVRLRWNGLRVGRDAPR